MSEGRITPDEFARLMTLPEAHPERRRAESTAEFAAMKAMFSAFEADVAPRPGEDAAIRDELARRLAPAGPVPSAGAPRGAPASPRPARTSGGGLGTMLAALFGPSGVRAVAFAVLLVVAGLGAWTMTRHPREDVMRGEHAGTFAITATAHPGRLELAWPAAAGADAYRVVLLGPDLGELARVDLGSATAWTVRRDSLPAGLESGRALSLEVQALQRGVVISRTPAREIRLP